MAALFQLVVSGVALGCIYALVALGFVLIFRATGVLNFAHPEFLLLGAYLILTFGSAGLGLPWGLALIATIVVTALIAVSFNAVVIRRMMGQPLFAIVIVTLGFGIALRQIISVLYGDAPRAIGSPWGAATVTVGEATITWTNLITIIVTVLIVGAFLAFNRFSAYGIGMRAAAFDEEAAAAVGIPNRRIHMLAWALAAAIAAIAGLLLASFPRSAVPELSFVALRAIPAAVLGGFDSVAGALVGGMLIGLAEVSVLSTQSGYADVVGTNFHLVSAYVVLLAVLWVRPHGLFGTPEIERV